MTNGMVPIGVFDSGYGGLTILSKIRQLMPQYDYLYLGDNARAPYGPHSFDVVYEFTRQAVETLFDRGCKLVVLACNTASAKALRSIQENDLHRWGADYRVLGVIRPTVEAVGALTRTRHIGVLATVGTINSGSYGLELHKLDPEIQVTGQACPMWVPLVEYGEYDTPGAEYFVKKRLDAILQSDPLIDTLILACTHYPLLLPIIRKYTPDGIKVVPQGEFVAQSLQKYLIRHPQMEQELARNGQCHYLTTESSTKFSEQASLFLNHPVEAEHIIL